MKFLSHRGSLVILAVTFFLAASACAEGVSAPLQAGRDLARERKFAEAAARFDQAVALSPASAEARFERGNALAELGQTARPLEDFTEAIRLKQDYYEAQYMRGHIYARLNDHRSAIKDFTSAILLRSDAALAYHYRGISHFELHLQSPPDGPPGESDKENDLAAEDFARAIQRDPKLAEAYYYHARATRSWEASIADYSAAIKLDPGHAAWFYWRANAYMFTDHEAEAIVDFTAAIRLDPDDQHAYNDRAALYSRKGQYDLAVADLTEAIRLKPELPFFRHNRGKNYLSLEKWDLARTDFNAALGLQPDYWECYTLRAKAEARLGDKKAALDDLAFGGDHREGETSVASFARGEAYTALGDYDKAVEAYSEYLGDNANDAPALINRGFAFSSAQKFDEALADLKQALELDPNNKYGRLTLGSIYFSRGDLENALAEYSRAMALDENSVEPRFMRAVIDFCPRRPEELKADAERCAALTGWSTERATYLALLRAIAAQRGGDQSAATAALDEVTAKGDASLWPYPAVRMLRGELTLEKLLEAAGDDLSQQTEARAYAGLSLAATNQQEKALPLLQWVREHGDKNTVEFTAAMVELKRLQP